MWIKQKLNLYVVPSSTALYAQWFGKNSVALSLLFGLSDALKSNQYQYSHSKGWTQANNKNKQMLFVAYSAFKSVNSLMNPTVGAAL
jgi:hypothetical protein